MSTSGQGWRHASTALLLACLALPLASAAVRAAETPDEVAAITRSAEHGNQGAQLLLGLIYLEGREGVARDPAKAVQWLRQAAQGDQPYAQYKLGELYATGQGVPQDPKQAIYWWRQAARQHQAAAELALGESYLYGRGVKPDPARAERWLRPAADQGNAQAQYLLGRMYRDGYGVPRDLERGKRWLERAAAQGQSDSIRLLSLMAEVGEEATEVYRQSGEELTRQARAGNVEAQYQLGLRYETGAWGVPQDNAKALYWLNRAAERGHKMALLTLADIYDKGLLGVTPDPKRAERLRAQAAR